MSSPEGFIKPSLASVLDAVNEAIEWGEAERPSDPSGADAGMGTSRDSARLSKAQSIQQQILESIRTLRGFDGGVVYVFYPGESLLRCLNWIDPPHPGREAPVYHLNSKSMIAKVYRSMQPHYCADPRSDPDINQEGIEAFEIRSSLVGVPLIHDGHCVGTLAVWSNRGPPPEREDMARLRPLANLAANIVWTNMFAQKQTKAILWLQDILRKTQTVDSESLALDSVANALVNFGFDRVRLYTFNEEFQVFEPICQAGSDPAPEFFTQGRIPVYGNFFAMQTFETAATDPRVQVFDPTAVGRVDPHHKILKKPPDLPWAVVPLVISGTLFGQIAVDFATTRRAFTVDQKEFLDAVGAMAAGVIANSRHLKMLAAPSISLLYGYVRAESTEEVLVKQMLVYLTCGEALGFNRALFFQLDEESQHFRYRCGLGSVFKSRHDDVVKTAQRDGLVNILHRAGELQDWELDDRLADFEIPASCAWLPQTAGAADVASTTQASDIAKVAPDFSDAILSDLRSRIDGRGFGVARVRMQGEQVGLFIVDRRWRQDVLHSDDLQVLGAFAHHATNILQKFALQRQLLQVQQVFPWRDASSNGAHTIIKSAMAAIWDLQTLRMRLTGALPEEASIDANVDECLRGISAHLTEIQRLTQWFLRMTKNLAMESLRLDELIQLIQMQIERSSIKCKIDWIGESIRSLLLHCDRVIILTTVFRELIQNAGYWMPYVQANQIHLKVSHRVDYLPPGLTKRDYVQIVFEDYGPGIAEGLEEQIFEPHVGFKSDSSGHGLGLSIAREIVRLHDGLIYAVPHQPKAEFVILLPVAAELSMSSLTGA